MPLCQGHLSSHSQGLDPSQESLAQPPNNMASLGLEHSDSSASAFQNNSHPSMLWVPAPAVIMEGLGGKGRGRVTEEPHPFL